jgi:hypothetical protein
MFHIIDGIDLIRSPIDLAPRSALSLSGFWGIAVWRRIEPEDSEQDFDFELGSNPGGRELKSIQSGTFKFTAPLHRFQIQFLMQATWEQNGDFIFVSRIRRAGTTSWAEQKYCFSVNVVQPAEATD